MASFTRNDVRSIMARVEKALAAEFGDEMKIDLGSVRYGTDEVRFSKLTVKSKEEGESDADLAKKEWEGQAHLIGLKAEDFNRVIDYGRSKKYKLVGIRLRRPKFPVAAVDVNTGKEMLLDINAVRRILGR